MRKTVIITAVIVIVSSLALMIFVRATTIDREAVSYAGVERGNFEITVSATGELVAQKALDIRGPNLVQSLNIRPMPVRLTDIVPEGTIVSKGDYIATLDRSSFANTLKDESDILRDLRSQLEMKLLDTAVALSALRDEIRNQYYVMEEAAITLEQSKFEPPAIQRLARVELEKAQRFLDYRQRLYNLRTGQTSSEVRNLRYSWERQRNKVSELQALLDGFIIRAPSDGIVMYKKDRNGIKRKAGSMISPFDPVIATLPDLSTLQSRIYVGETDVTKLSHGLPVQVSVDAFGEKSFSGQIVSVANIGEQLSNTDSKVFEVLVKIVDSDPRLRPAMTTGNRVVISSLKDVLYVPAVSVHAGADSIPFVYTREGKKQIVMLGDANDRHIVIERGLDEGVQVWSDVPADLSKFRIAGADLIPHIRQQNRERKLALENGINPAVPGTSRTGFFPPSSGNSGTSAASGGN
ncbi:MAG: HlyD family efflux transporter periplasmic adaptor subunit [Bacteroidales bacterium]|nr:HlyD family efflux transporter periplasmic adaptor subunit [Bacteroidales bacterium]